MATLNCNIYKIFINGTNTSFIDSIDVTSLLQSYNLNVDIENRSNSNVTLSLYNKSKLINQQLRDIGLYFDYLNIGNVIDNSHFTYLINISIDIGYKKSLTYMLDSVEINEELKTMVLNVSSLLYLFERYSFDPKDYKGASNTKIATINTFLQVLDTINENIPSNIEDLFTGFRKLGLPSYTTGLADELKESVVNQTIRQIYRIDVNQEIEQEISDIISYPAQSAKYIATPIPVSQLVDVINSIFIWDLFVARDRIGICLAKYECFDTLRELDILHHCESAISTSSVRVNASNVIFYKIPLLNSNGDRMKIVGNNVVVDKENKYYLNIASFFTDEVINTQFLKEDISYEELIEEFPDMTISEPEDLDREIIYRDGQSIESLRKEIALYVRHLFSHSRTYFNFTYRISLNPKRYTGDLQLGDSVILTDNGKQLGNWKVVEENVVGDTTNLKFNYVLASLITIL